MTAVEIIVGPKKSRVQLKMYTIPFFRPIKIAGVTNG